MDNIYNVIILDESGSMSSIYKETLTGINEVLNGIKISQEKHHDQCHFVTIVTFEGNGMEGVKTRRDRVPIDAVKPFTEDDYRPGGCTPLYDAMGKTLHEVEGQIDERDKVFVTVITDGMENASTEYSGKIIKNLVARLREKGWVLAYIGANQDSIEVARDLNIGNALNYSATGKGVKDMSVKWSRSSMRLYEKFAEGEDLRHYENLFESEETKAPKEQNPGQ